MFEKEAEKYISNLDECRTKDLVRDSFKDGAEFGYDKANEELEEKYKETLYNLEMNLNSVTERLEILNHNEWHNLNENYKDLPNEGEWVEGLYLWYYKDEPHWDVFKVRWYHEIGELDEKLVRWYDSDNCCNSIDEPNYWRKITLPMRSEK